jgi:hypothetical protein
MQDQDVSHRKNRPKPGNMGALQRICWRALLAAEDVLVSTADPELKLRAATSIGQLSGYYTRVVETLDLAARMAALEEAVKKGGRS